MSSSQSTCVILAALGLSLIAGASALPHPRSIIDSSSIHEFQAMDLFNNFKTTYGRSYKGPLEDGIRYSIFRDNINKINELNAKHPKAHFKINKFADMTQEEMQSTHMGFIPPVKGTKQYKDKQNIPVMKFDNDGFNATTSDWRTKGAVSPVKDQGQCGSCWAFSAVETIESSVFLSTGKLPILSEQQVVSCDKVDGGCNGGWPHEAYKYVEQDKLESEVNYPYVSGTSGATGTCKYNSQYATQAIKGFSYAIPSCENDPDCTKQDETTMANAIAQTGPASICLNANAFSFYDSGILTADTCGDSSYYYLNHCIQMVGFDLTDSTNQYWIARNSWGANWGESGYLRMEFGTNTCGLADEVTFVQV